MDFGLWTGIHARPARGPARDSSFSTHHSSFCNEWGNPSSAYKFGSKLKGVIETARAQVAIASLLTVNLGDDADSTGALCGQFAGGDLHLKRESPSGTARVRACLKTRFGVPPLGGTARKPPKGGTRAPESALEQQGGSP